MTVMKGRWANRAGTGEAAATEKVKTTCKKTGEF